MGVAADMDVTPGTRKSKGGTAWPSRSAHGSTKPPRHASVWKPIPRCRRCGRQLLDGVDDAVREAGRGAHHHDRVRSSMAAAMAATSARLVGADGHLDELHAEVLRRLVERGVGA